MPSAAPYFVCAQCGQTQRKWSGQCAQCGEWNSLTPQTGAAARPIGKKAQGLAQGRAQGRAHELHSLTDAAEMPTPTRRRSGMGELDRVTGGGLVAGSVLLLGGDPGIGKSTLLMQIAGHVGAKAGAPVLYVSGEESLQQLRLRAQRLGIDAPQLDLTSLTQVDDILATLRAERRHRLILVDSIQTMWTSQLDAPAGTVTQLRAATQLLLDYAKAEDATVILVGHVTKDGQIAGPRVLEHMVDVVIYFEGEATSGFRLVRAVKNRFGPANEIGVFEMQERGLVEVPNPSEMFLRGRDAPQPGSAVLAGLAGTRPLLVEVQALSARSSLAQPRRAVLGWNQARLSMILAVLETRAGLRFGAQDVFLNIAGGLHIRDTGADLAVAAALASAAGDRAWPSDLVVFGELSLSGALRPVGQSAARLKEAARLGFRRALMPPAAQREEAKAWDAILPCQTIASVRDLPAFLDRISGKPRMPDKSRMPDKQ